MSYSHYATFKLKNSYIEMFQIKQTVTKKILDRLKEYQVVSSKLNARVAKDKVTWFRKVNFDASMKK